MTGSVCCIVLDCRRTGRPNHPDRPFICQKHMAVVGPELLREYDHAAGANKRSRGQSRHWRYLEQSTWEQICNAVSKQFELKPKASSATTSGN